MSLDTVQNQAPAAAPSVDFNDASFSVEDLRGALATGDLSNLTPPAGTDSSTPPVVTPPADQAGVGDPAALPAQDPPATPTKSEAAEGTPETPAAADPAKEEAPAPKEEEAPPFQFTADADDEVFAKERAQYTEQFELDPATQFLIDRQDKTIADLRAQVEAAQAPEVPSLYTEAVQALDALVTRVRDDANRPVPNTEPLVSFLSKSFPQELPDLAESLLAMPSSKYHGTTLFQQYIRDYGNLDEQGLYLVQQVIENGGRLPIPSYVPVGIDPNVAEAFWQAPNRQTILDQVEAQYEIIQDPLATPADKQTARNYIYQVNQSLAQVQYGLDARVKAQRDAAESQQRAQMQIEQAGDQAYAETSAALTRSFADRLASNLDMFDAPAARVTALAYGNLIVNALADDMWAPYAQADLAKEGIQFNWAEGRKALERLRNAEHNIAGHVATKASPAAVEIAKKEKAAAIKEVKRLELDLMGKISKVAVLGASKALEGKAASSPKTPAARPRATAAAAAGSANAVPSIESPLTAYDQPEMSIEELRARIGKLRAENGLVL